MEALPIAVKVRFGDERRRFMLEKAEESFQDFSSRVSRLFNLPQHSFDRDSPARVGFKYLDEDGDMVTLSTQEEWTELIKTAAKNDRKINLELHSSISTDADRAASVSAAPVQLDKQVAIRQAIIHRLRTGVFDKRPPRGAIWPKATKANLPPVITHRRTERSGSTDSNDGWELIHPKSENQSRPRKLLTVPDEIKKAFSNSITFYLNGQAQTLSNPDPNMKIAEYLREQTAVTGTKVGCNEGGCGACTVVVSREDHSGNVISLSANACLHPVCALDGWSVTTTEGIGSQRSGFHPIQSQLAACDGSQCGYCSPGMVMEMYGLLVNNPKPDIQTIEDNFDGNICRCTGYRAILKAMHSFAPGAPSDSVSIVGPQVCKKGSCCDVEDICCEKKASVGNMLTGRKNVAFKAPKTSFDPKLHGIKFPEAARGFKRRALYFHDAAANVLWFSPADLKDVFQLLNTYAEAVVRLVVGNTSIGVDKYYIYNPEKDNPYVYIDVALLPELTGVTTTAAGVQFGASVTITSLLNTFTTLKAQGGVYFAALVRHLKHVANNQVRNMASWAGNLMLCHSHPEFASDLATIFQAVGATITLASSGSTRSMDVSTFLTTRLATDEIILNIFVPFPPTNAAVVFDTFKVAERHQNAHAIINAGFKFNTDSKFSTISSATLVFGGVGSGPVVAVQTMAYLMGKPLNGATLAAALPILQLEVTPPPDPPNPNWVLTSPLYRQSLSVTLFYKFFLTAMSLQTPNPLPSRLISVTQRFHRDPSSGTQVFTPYLPEAPVSEPIHKLSATLQASGEAVYTDDMPPNINGLQAAPVLSTVPMGTIQCIDASTALSMPGVVAFISAQDIADIGGSNNCGDFPGDEEIFASTNITHVGQTIGMIVADTREHAKTAAKAVNVSYGPPSPPAAPLFTIKDAIAAQSFLTDNPYVHHIPSISCGDLNKGFGQADAIFTGELYTSPQAHFYMETQAALAIPDENDILQLYCSSQGPATVRQALVTALNVPANKLIVVTKRAGGGFGGKLSRDIPVSAAVCVAAIKLLRPVRMQYDRNTDMNAVGKRHDHWATYKVGVKKDGTLTAFTISYYSNGGSSYDASLGCMDMCQLWADNTYFLQNYMSQGFSMRTNLPPNTAMRAPGALNSIFFIESVMERIACELKLDPLDVRARNFYQNGQLTPYGQPVLYSQLQTVWNEVIANADYNNRKQAVTTFNAANRWRKRGIRVTPVKYAIGVSSYQCAVLINVMVEDGTIEVCHGGVEIGQGINTKVAQVIAYELGVDISLIAITSTSTEKIPNFTNTGGSGTSEATCAAAIAACQTLNTTLEPIKKANPKATWPQLCGLAVAAGCNLSATGYFTLSQEVGGFPFTYYVFAAACSEVEVDVLSGEVHIIRSDIVYDAGYSLNYAIDLGQVEGAFVQGLGFFFTENVVYMNGRMVNNGTWDYKPPCSKDIPIVFNVTFLSATPNPAPNAILSSKATGEPPYMLATSAFFAAKDAIMAARADAGLSGYVQLDTPITVDQIQLACGITLSQLNVTGN